MARLTLAACALAGLGACFTGNFLSGQPCQADADCGPSLACEDGVCGGTGGPVTTGPPTTDPPTTTTTEPPTTEPPTTTTTSDTTTTTLGDDTTTGTSTTDDSTTDEPCGLGRCKDLDLMLVIDNSPSMKDDGEAMLAALLKFQEYMSAPLLQACSIHVGVTTTDPAYAQNPIECQKPGALVQADELGTQCMFTEGFPYATLPDLDNPGSLLCLANVGDKGSTNEQPIAALLSTFDQTVNQAGACNEGFIRKGAQMVMIVATDEDDDDLDAQGHSGTNLSSNLWYPSLVALKPPKDILAIGLLGDPDPGVTKTCDWMPELGDDGIGAEPSPRLRDFFAAFPEGHKATASLCQDDDMAAYDAVMQVVLQQLMDMCEV